MSHPSKRKTCIVRENIKIDYLCLDLFFIYSIVKLPYTDGSAEIGDYEEPSKNLSRMSNPLSSTSVKMTKAAIAGIDIKRLKSFMPGKVTYLLNCLRMLHVQYMFF